MVEKIRMNIDETLELDYLIEQVSNDAINITDRPNNSSTSIEYISTQTGIFNPDNTGIYHLDINGQTFEIDVYDISNSGSLQARYDARNLSLSNGDEVSTWSDESGNGNDLTIEAGSPTYKTLNDVGLPAVDYSTADIHSVSFDESFSAPWSVFFLGRTLEPYNDFSVFWSNYPAKTDEFLGLGVNDNFFRWMQNNIDDSNIGGTVSTSSFISSSFIQSSTGTTRKNGSNVGSGSITAGSLDGISVAGSEVGTAFASVVTEILIYSDDESANTQEIEQHLDRNTSLL